jgi:hypothetical protein
VALRLRLSADLPLSAAASLALARTFEQLVAKHGLALKLSEEDLH